MPAEDGARRYLLATAVPHHRPELSQARQDAVDLFTGRLGYEHVTTLGEDPTAARLTRALRDFCTDPDRRPDDLVVLYVAARSAVVEADGRHVLLTSEHRPEDLAAALPADDLAGALLGTPVSRFLLVLDTWFSGRDADPLPASAAAGSAPLVVLSCAQEDEFAVSGAFPALLREAVDSLAKTGARGVLPLSEVVRRMRSGPNRPGHQHVTWHSPGPDGALPPFLALPRPAPAATPLSVARRSGAGPLFADAEPPLLKGIDGEQRRRAALDLWDRWTKQRRSAALLHGFPGVGKTDRVVRPLMDEARLLHGRTTVLVDVPESPVDARKELLGLLHEQVERTGRYELAEDLASEQRLDRALATLLDHGVLVVVDEFQRLLDEHGRPVQPIADDLKSVVAPGRRGDGCLWLVSNQKVDPVWAQDFSPVELPPPPVEDAVRILVGSRTPDEAEQWFPSERRVEVVERLSRNPFCLTMLHSMVGPYDSTLEEVLGPPSQVPQAPYDLSLVETIERELIAKATERLTPPAKAALRNLAVLADWADQDLVKAMTQGIGDWPELRKQLQKRFLLQVRTVDNETAHARTTHFQVHPVVREVVCVRMREDEKSWRAAHRRAGLWYARPLFAQDPSRSGDHRLALALSAARLHFAEGGLDDELARVARTIGGYLERMYGKGRHHHSLPESPAELSARIDLMTAYLADGGTPFTHHHLALLLRDRDAPGDREKALVHAREATRGRSEMHPWSLLLKLLRDVEGPEATVREGRIALRKVKEQKFAVYDEIAKCEVRLGRVPQALETLREGCADVRYKDAYRLADHAVPYAAAEPDEEPLVETARWIRENPALTAQAYQAEALLLQRQGRWLESARAARSHRPAHPKVINLALYEAIGWLGAGDPAKARHALDTFPDGIPNSPRPKPHEGKTWLVSLIALLGGDLDRAGQMFALYQGAPREDRAPEELRAALLYEWDHPATRADESNPAFVAPVLPPAVTGLLSLMVRPQYGPPVLPAHR